MKRSSVELRSLAEIDAASPSLLGKFGRRHPCCRASIRTLSGPLVGPVHVGVRSKTRVYHGRDGPGIVGSCHLSRDLMDQRSLRSHPNKAVDVVVVKLQGKVLDPGAINSCLL